MPFGSTIDEVFAGVPDHSYQRQAALFLALPDSVIPIEILDEGGGIPYTNLTSSLSPRNSITSPSTIFFRRRVSTSPFTVT